MDIELTDDREARARALLTTSAYDYYAGGADDERTLHEAPAAWGALRLRPHVLRDVSAVSTTTTVLGTPVSSPVLVAPMAFQRLAHDDGEAATAAAAREVGTLMCLSTLSTTSMEVVAEDAGPLWYQLYVHRDRGWTAELVARAAAAGFRAIVLTLDFPVAGNRRRDERNGFSLPPGVALADVPHDMPATQGSGLASYAATEMEPALTPELLTWVAGLGLPVVVKGVLRGDDAVRCLDAGATAIAVSTHGGRQLDTAVPTPVALPDVVQAVGDRAEVLVDGGVRRGTDVVKALALGARAVLLGRPVLWGLATGGRQGVVDVLEELHAETARAMTLCGAASVADLTGDLLGP